MEFLLGITSFATVILSITSFRYWKKAKKYDVEREEFIRAEEKLLAIEQKIKDEAKHLPQQFENIANKILENTNEKFSKQSKENLSTILNPFNEKITELQKRVVEERGILQKQVESITFETHNLTKALRSDSKTQGNWGEFALERLLESSGLKEGTHYISQGKGLNLKNSEGSRIMPDFIIKLPENRNVIIDSKVSLTHYERYINEEDEEQKGEYLKQFIYSVKTHINDLSKKEYHNTENIGSIDFTFMYMPIEGAYFLISQEDAELHKYAWDNSIVIVSPPTLFANLKTISSIWRMNSQNKNAEEIARQGGEIYKKFANFISDMQVIKRGMDMSEKAYDAAINKLSEGRGNLISRAEKLKELGIKTSKSLPNELLNNNKKNINAENDESVDEDDFDNGKIKKLSNG